MEQQLINEVLCQMIPHLSNDQISLLKNVLEGALIKVGGNPEKAVELLTANDTRAFADVIPLTLEEIFIYEMGGVDYEVKDFLL